MNDDANFGAWKRARRDGTVPQGFADRVMAGLPPREGRLRLTGTMRFLSVLTASLPARVAVTLLAVTVFIYRAACAFGVLFTG